MAPGEDAVKSLMTCVVGSALIGCGAGGMRPTATTGSDVASSDAELASLRAELEARADELRQVRGQLALSRAELQVLRAGSDEPETLGSEASASSKQDLPWLQTPVTVDTAQGEREVLEVFEEERLATTARVPDLPAFIEEDVLAAPEIASATVVDSGVEDYRRALGLVQEQRFDEALSALSAFLDVHPNHPYADNALFWRGEIHFLRHAYDRALEDFRTVEKHHPWGNKLPDALYRIGQIHSKRGDDERARAYFDRVREQFPDTAAARLAQREDAS